MTAPRTAPTGRFLCAQAARSRGDALGGTAPRGTFWVLIEHRGAWPINGFDGLDLDPEVYAAVFSAAQARRARILLVRRHGARGTSPSARWGVMHLAGPGDLRQEWGSWREDEDLGRIPGALSRVQIGEGSPREGSSPPVILVCAHAQHDVCCAIEGRPVARELARRWPEQVWECSHVGGDRFAANVLVVPDGVYYGNLAADSAVPVLEGHLADRIDAAHLRGYTDLAPVEQVAVGAALHHDGPAGRFAHGIESAVFEDGHWRVLVHRTSPHRGLLEVALSATRSAPQQLTCRGLQKASAVQFAVEAVREVDLP
ncbi:MAG: sucrase ferredoxin [Brachybacterium sp.]|nr:sucrase ferredoxin [Brachybacterium sp.]